MTFHKSRLAAVLSLMLFVCFMVSIMAVPVSAAENSYPVGTVSFGYGDLQASSLFLEAFGFDLQGYPDYLELANAVKFGFRPTYLTPEAPCFFVVFAQAETLIKRYNSVFGTNISLNDFMYNVYYDESAKLIQVPISYNYTLANYDKTAVFDSTYAPPEPEPPATEPPATEPPVIEPVTPSGSAFAFLTQEQMWHLMDDIKGILPACMQVLVGYIAIRKGIQFLQWCMNKA